MENNKKVIREASKGYKQLTSIIDEIICVQTYPSWDFVNGVLSCKEILGENKLWFHWGYLLIHRPEDEGKKAGEHLELEDWNTEDNGMITLIGRKQIKN